MPWLIGATIVGWLLALVLGVSYFKSDTVMQERLSACTAKVSGLTTRAAAAEGESKAARAASARLGAELARRADKQLGAPATRPGDACGSAEDRVKAWQNSRR